MGNFLVRKVAVLGAGVMGAQIGAHCANADVPVLLFDLPAPSGDPNGIVLKALDGLKKLDPAPLAARDRILGIEPANYQRDLARLAECDLVIEAIAERMDWKLDLYRRIAPHLAPQALLASNTSGLSIAAMAEALPEDMRARFCGVHFFNPPRYMALVELIAAPATDPRRLDALETFLTSTLGKSCVRAKDTPNFIANRVGVFSILAVMHHTQRLGLGFDEVDALTGPLIGRPKSATFRTADVVGLDTLAHVVNTMRDTLPDDPWHSLYEAPAWLRLLIERGALGQKTRAGIYRKEGKAIKVLDLGLKDYRDSAGAVADEVATLLKTKNPAERFAGLRASRHPQAQFLWAIFRDVFHYCAVHLGAIADNARDVDLALRWGFGWQQGPFETWQAAGWAEIAAAIEADRAAGATLADVPLPDWVMQRAGVHETAGSWSAAQSMLKPRLALPVYKRQLFPERVLGEKVSPGTTLFENAAVRFWHTDEHGGGDVAILSFKSKMHTMGPDVLEGIVEAVERAERDHKALVIWQPEPPFSAGANLAALGPAFATGDWGALERAVAQFQATTRRVQYAQVPVVSALQGLTLGGGCELTMHSAHVVAALESYVGLVEAGVGLIPAGGGCKEFAVRAASAAARTTNNDPFPFLTQPFQTIALATVAKSALEAKEFGFLRPADTVAFHAQELLFVAKKFARTLAEANWRPALPPRGVKVAGRDGIATFELMLVNMREGGQISAHDYRVARAAAVALCGGEVDPGTLVDERWLLDVERHQFLELLKSAETQARIRHMLETGKPLRN